ncbi:MAG: FHA domain-containing protein [Acidobacteria bacterium]|nr:FHA domain-containing protein [Acidobacteriota bacterium]
MDVTLSYYDDAGRLRRVQVESKRFLIGRIPDNDLMIEHSSLSRRHALIESFDDGVQISDCGSRNGTFLNGSPVTLPVELHDGDMINLADVVELTVEMANADEAQAVYASAPVAKTPAPVAPQPQARLEDETTASGLNVYIIAPVIALVLLALVALAAVALKSGGSKKTDADRQPNANRRREEARELENTNPQALPSPDASVGGDTPPSQTSDELDEVERNALAVMRGISKSDSSPVLTEQSIKEIDERIKRYNGSSVLRDNLRAVKQRGVQQLAADAKSNDLKLPLLIFAALAKMDKDGSRGDPVAVAQSLIPSLSRSRVVIGNELANESLLCVAVLDSSTGGAMALRDTMAEMTKKRPDASPAMIRSVWFLHENQKLSPQAYDLVLRFLSIGAVAQNPKRYGIEAEPLTF